MVKLKTHDTNPCTNLNLVHKYVQQHFINNIININNSNVDSCCKFVKDTKERAMNLNKNVEKLNKKNDDNDIIGTHTSSINKSNEITIECKHCAFNKKTHDNQCFKLKIVDFHNTSVTNCKFIDCMIEHGASCNKIFSNESP